MFAPGPYRRSNLSQDNLSLVRLGSRFSVCSRDIISVHLDTAKVERALLFHAGEPFVSEARDLGKLVYKV